MSEKAVISIIVPIYNSEKYLKDCFDSILNQTMSDYEVIMVDDCSSDKSAAIAMEYAGKHDNWHFYEVPHGGVSAARNYGITCSSGQYVFFLDSDDRIESALLEILCSRMKEHKAGIGVSYFRRFGRSVSSNLMPDEKHNVEHMDGETALRRFCSGFDYGLAAIGGKLILKELLPEGLFRTDISYGEDTLFMYEILLKGLPVVFTDEAFYEYRIHDTNAVSSPNIRHISDVCYVRKHIADREAENGHGENSFYWYFGIPDAIIRYIERIQSSRLQKEQLEQLRTIIKACTSDSRYVSVSKFTRLKLSLFCSAPRLYFLISGHDVAGENKCYGCEACADVCPNHCITMKYSSDGFRYPVIDKKRCTDCGMCRKVCPQEGNYDVKNTQQYYAMQAGDEVRKVSTSGGAFRILAEHVISEGGAVAGAVMDNMEVRHIVVDNISDLKKLSGSKYVQSRTEGIYTSVKTYLNSGRKVLFSGTPCQVEAMRRIAGDNENLILVDLVCNGVASPVIWKRYTRLMRLFYRKKPLDFSFRDKRNKDDGHTVSIRFANGEKTKSMYSDMFCRTYFNGASERRKCSSCLFSTDKRQSDITIGDFWGVEKYKPEWNDGMGTSLVITHTQKGEAMLSILKQSSNVIEISEKQSRQPRLLSPVPDNAVKFKAKRMYRIIPFPIWLKWFGSK